MNLYSCPQTRSWCKRGQQHQALGRSRGGFTSKLHAQVDTLGNPVEFILTGGECADITVAPQLIKQIAGCIVIADKGYDSDDFVKQIEAQQRTTVIPPHSNRKTPREYDRHLYKERHLVENLFNKIEEYWRIATRYEKLANTFLSFVHLAASLIWIKYFANTP